MEMREKVRGKGFMQIVLIILGIIWTLWFMIPVFTKRIVNIGNATGIVIGLLLILLGVFLPTFGSFLVMAWKSMVGRIIEVAVGIFASIILVLAIYTASLMVYGMQRVPTENATLVVLGCKVYGTKPSLMLRERLDAAIIYLNENPESACVVSGGKGDDEDVPEAEAMKNYLLEKGIAEDRIYVENQSVSTRENLKFANEIIEKEGLSTTIAIATNDFHEYRAYRIAKALDLESGAVPGRTAWWLLPTYALREMYGILYEYVF